MRTIQRMMKRSGLPVEYSKGFNPHINMSLAQPLAVGAYSSGDYMDASFETELNEDMIKEKLNDSAPMGIKVFEAVKIKDEENKKVFKSMAAIDAAKYYIKIKYFNTETLRRDIEILLKQEKWDIVKKSKSGEGMVNTKPMIKNFSYKIEENILEIETTVSCGSRENLSPELLAKFIQENTKEANIEAFIDIKREEMYAKLKNKLVPLCEYVKMI
jgi:radical SAM-linked protein